ncbi:MAG: NUDIX domain-containing protein [Lachnospiraceae bacterium]|nr:NUDIX domain-containing protein [Lachnospiraceae bacterium]
MTMDYCMQCGTKLEIHPLEGEGDVPYCPHCQDYRFPVFNAAVSMIVLNPSKDKILLIQQYGRKNNILVAGYINKGENAEHAVRREVEEEMGLELSRIHFNKTEYFEPSNTLMINFTCVAKSDDLSHMTSEVDYAAWYSFKDAAKQIRQHSLAQNFLNYYLTTITQKNNDQ